MFGWGMGKPTKHLVIAAMRNEGPFILEWVAWYRMLGFEVLVLTNDCTDRSPALLDALEMAGWLTHVRHQPVDGEAPKKSAHRHARLHPGTQEADWIFVCDVDEFLVLHRGDGTVACYLDSFDIPFRGIGVHWRCFGTSGVDDFADTPIHQQFVHASEHQHWVNRNFKTLFHGPKDFGSFGAHGPRMKKGRWGTPQERLITGDGTEIESYHPRNSALYKTEIPMITHETAQINHYILRSFESFSLKLGTPSASQGVSRYTPMFFENHNRNEVEDRCAFGYSERFAKIHAEVMELPGVALLHYMCVADYVERLCIASETKLTDDARWIAAMNHIE